jgi:hypothetical protein
MRYTLSVRRLADENYRRANAAHFGFVNYTFEPWHRKWTGGAASAERTRYFVWLLHLRSQ